MPAGMDATEALRMAKQEIGRQMDAAIEAKRTAALRKGDAAYQDGKVFGLQCAYEVISQLSWIKEAQDKTH